VRQFLEVRVTVATGLLQIAFLGVIPKLLGLLDGITGDGVILDFLGI